MGKPRTASLGLKTAFDDEEGARRPCINEKKRPHMDITTLATAWYLKNARALSRRQALQACVEYLMESQEVSEDTADRVAMHALAELESRNQKARIDVGASTAHCVIVHRPDGKPLAFTVNDLVRLHAAHAAAPQQLTAH